MGGNKEEALKCLKIARQAIEFRDRVRAQRFITKAQLLDPSLSTADILSKLNNRPAEPSKKPSHARPRVRVSEPGSSSTASLGYTEEHIAIVREINKKKNYYAILGVEESCTAEDIRKAYRKLSFCKWYFQKTIKCALLCLKWKYILGHPQLERWTNKMGEEGNMYLWSCGHIPMWAG